MSYIVLARKWRPQGFKDLVGQESVVKTFNNALSGDKIVHAYVFSGPRGVGKTSTARILAKALNCEERKESDPCGKCSNCVAITEGSSVDVIEIDGASNTSVDSIRELREAVKYAPSGGKYKIYIIDEVHMLSTAAFNALLKTLEEPPSHVVFIFATTEAKKIPSTILSRCQHHSFRRITRSEIKGQLKHITDSEKITISDTALEMISKAADGSMRDALTLLDQAYSFTDNITEKELQSLLGLPEIEIISNLSRTILTGDISSTLGIIKEMTDRGSDLRQLTKELVEQFRNLAVVKITTDPEGLLEFSGEEIQRLRDLSSDVGIEQLTLILTEMLRLETEVRLAVNPRYTLELGLLRTSFIKGMTSIESILKMIGGEEELPATTGKSVPPLEKKTKPAPEPSSPVKVEVKTESLPKPIPPVKPDEKPAVKTAEPAPEINMDVHEEEPEEYPDSYAYPDANDTGQVDQPSPEFKPGVNSKEELWHDLLKKLDSEDHRLSLKLEEASPIDLTATEFSIGFKGGLSILADLIRSKSSLIEKFLQEISGRKLKMKIMSLPKEKKKDNSEDIKEKIFAEPIVMDALRIFSGSVVKVRTLDNNK